MSLDCESAEAALLGAVLSDAAIYDAVADLVKADDFAWPVHGRMFAYAAGVYAGGDTKSAVGAMRVFRDDPDLQEVGGAKYIAQLTWSGLGLLAPDALAKQIAELATRRRLKLTLSQAAGACDDLGRSVNDIKGLVEQATDLDDSDPLQIVTAAQATQNYLDTLDAPQDGVHAPDLFKLDDLLGPLQTPHLIVVAGRPGSGKTALACSYANSAVRAGHGVLFASIEMGGREIAGRMIADNCFARPGYNPIPYNAIQSGRLNIDQISQIDRLNIEGQSRPLHVIDHAHLTISSLKRTVKRSQRIMAADGHKLELVIVDYLQIMSGEQPGMRKIDEISDISRGLKRLAKQCGVAVMALAQLSREVEKREDKTPMLSDLRESGQIEQDADIVLFLKRDAYYLMQKRPAPGSLEFIEWQEKYEAVKHDIDFILAKKRHGAPGVEKGEFYGAYQAVR